MRNNRKYSDGFLCPDESLSAFQTYVQLVTQRNLGSHHCANSDMNPSPSFKGDKDRRKAATQ